MKLKPFNLERALAGDRVVTRDCKEVSQLKKFYLDAGKCCVAAIIDGAIAVYLENGRFHEQETTNMDLFMVEEDYLKIEVGKFYKNRKGEKCYVYYSDYDDVYDEKRWCEYVTLNYKLSIEICINGRVYIDEFIDHPDDLIEEWKD